MQVEKPDQQNHNSTMCKADNNSSQNSMSTDNNLTGGAVNNNL